jgi:hypothetical protein
MEMEIDLHEFDYKIVQGFKKTQLYLEVVVYWLMESIHFLAIYENANRDIRVQIY